MLRILLFLLGYTISLAGFAQNLKVQFEGVRSPDGKMRIGFYQTEEDFKKEVPNYRCITDKATLNNGVVTCNCPDVPAGTYAAACVDDENDSGLMDWGWVLPKEGFGFSNYYHGGLSKPKWERFKFTLPEEGTTIVFKLRYL